MLTFRALCRDGSYHIHLITTNSPWRLMKTRRLVDLNELTLLRKSPSTTRRTGAYAPKTAKSDGRENVHRPDLLDYPPTLHRHDRFLVPFAVPHL